LKRNNFAVFTHGKLSHKGKDQSHIHAIALEKFLEVGNVKLRQNWGKGTSVSWILSWPQPSAV